MFDRTQPLVSIVIPAWFKKNQDGKYGKNETFWFAQECLKKMIERTSKELYELIIIDNGSTLTDNDIFLSQMPSEAIGKGEVYANQYLKDWMTINNYWSQADILIRNQKNLGFGPACNQGFNLARGEYIICINNDVIVWPGWIEALLNTFKQKLTPPPGVVMPALMKEIRDAREALKMETIDLTQNLGIYGRGAEFGSLWCIPRNIMEQIKKINKGYVFDENFRLGMGEDRKLWCQIRQLNYETYRTHETRIFHQGNMTISKVPDRKQYTEKNREYLSQWKKEQNIT